MSVPPSAAPPPVGAAALSDSVMEADSGRSVSQQQDDATGATTSSAAGALNGAASCSQRSWRKRAWAWVREGLQFGTVGGLAFIVDIGLFNLLQHGPARVLAGHPNTANVISAVLATLFSWQANRWWTYRGRRRSNVAHEALLFAFANVGGILITQFCLVFTHEILGHHSALADNISAYVVGFGLGTAFRFVFYHYIVFTGTPTQPADAATVRSAVMGGVPVTHVDEPNVPDPTAKM